MDYRLFEALAPLCPRCLHFRGNHARVRLAAREDERGGLLWHGCLCCESADCQLEFPVIDGIPLIVADPVQVMQSLSAQLLRRGDLPAGLESMIGDALGPGVEFDTARQHMSLYGESHYGDWAGLDSRPGAVATVARALEALPDLPGGPALDLGSGPGRTTWELASGTGRQVLGCDLSLTFLRMAQQLKLEGRLTFPRRRVGLVYDPVTVELPAGLAGAGVDFWALDVQRLPFPDGMAALVGLVNVVDCVPGPTELVTEAARVAAPGAGALVTTPFDWSPAATPPAGWFGGHSQRAAHRGSAEVVLQATVERAGWRQIASRDDIDWHLRLHERSAMTYRLHMALLRRETGSEAGSEAGA